MIMMHFYAVDYDDTETYLGVEQPIVYGFEYKRDRDEFVKASPDTRAVIKYHDARKYVIWYDEDGEINGY